MASQIVFSFAIQGLPELDRMLKQLPKAMAKSVMMSALKKAAKPIRDEAIANTPLGGTGNLRKSIVISTRLKRSQRSKTRRDEAEIFVGSTAPHAHLIEFGTGMRERESGGSTGKVTAMPFMRNAWDAMKWKAKDILQIEVWKALEKAVKRLRTKAEKGTLGRAAARALKA